MKLSRSVKPISYLKGHTAEALRTVASTGEPMLITQNGEARAVLQSVEDFEQMQESLALLKMISLSHTRLDEQGGKPVAEVFSRLRRELRDESD